MIGGPNPNAWNNWYQAVGSTYGTWVIGDARGVRTFRHRLHVEGDYRDPPPDGVWAPLFEYSKRNMRYPPLKLNSIQCHIVCTAMVAQLLDDCAEVVAMAVAVNHFHGLIRFPTMTREAINQYKNSILRDGRDPAPRHFLGLARKHASEVLYSRGLKPESPVWASRPKLEPIRDRRHQVNTAHYIRDHVHQGAAVYYLGAFLWL